MKNRKIKADDLYIEDFSFERRNYNNGNTKIKIEFKLTPEKDNAYKFDEEEYEEVKTILNNSIFLIGTGITKEVKK